MNTYFAAVYPQSKAGGIDPMVPAISKEIEIHGDDSSLWGEIEKGVEEIAASGTVCCIKWYRPADGQLGYWGPHGASLKPHWYACRSLKGDLHEGDTLKVTTIASIPAPAMPYGISDKYRPGQIIEVCWVEGVEHGFYRNGGELIGDATRAEALGAIIDDFTARVWGMRAYLHTPGERFVGIGYCAADSNGEVLVRYDWQHADFDKVLADALNIYFGPLREHLIKTVKRQNSYQDWLNRNAI